VHLNDAMINTHCIRVMYFISVMKFEEVKICERLKLWVSSSRDLNPP